MIKMKGDGGSKPCRPPRPPGNTFCPRPFLDVKHGAGRFLRGSEEPLWPLDGKYGCETRTMDRADGVVVQLAAWRTLRQIGRPIAYTVQHVHHRGSCQSHNAFPMVLHGVDHPTDRCSINVIRTSMRIAFTAVHAQFHSSHRRPLLVGLCGSFLSTRHKGCKRIFAVVPYNRLRLNIYTCNQNRYRQFNLVYCAASNRKITKKI